MKFNNKIKIWILSILISISLILGFNIKRTVPVPTAHNVKTFVSDIDGTLFSSDNVVLPQTTWALDKASAKGKDIILSSGRTQSSINKIADELNANIQYTISSNGAFIWDRVNKKIIRDNFLNRDEVNKVLVNPILSKLPILFQYGKQGQDYAINFTAKEIDLFEKWDYGKYQILSNDQWDKIQRANIVQIFIPKDPAQVQKIKNELLKHFHKGDYQSEFFNEILFDISKKGSTKGEALKYLSQKNILTSKSTVAFGDGVNDISMIKWVRYGYAMGNAKEELKKEAYEVIGTHDTSAIADKVSEILESQL